MKPKNLLISAFICWIGLLIQQSDGLFFTTTGAGTGAGLTFAGGSAGSANAAVLLGGLIVAKAVGFGILALLLVNNNRLINI